MTAVPSSHAHRRIEIFGLLQGLCRTRIPADQAPQVAEGLVGDVLSVGVHCFKLLLLSYLHNICYMTAWNSPAFLPTRRPRSQKVLLAMSSA